MPLWKACLSRSNCLPISLEQEIARQTGLALQRGLDGAHPGMAIVKDRDIGPDELTVALLFKECVGLGDGQGNGGANRISRTRKLGVVEVDEGEMQPAYPFQIALCVQD